MDGNVRWSKKKKVDKKEGYKKGLDKVKEIVELCIENKVKFLSLFALSSENIKRSSVKIIFDIITNQFNDLIGEIFNQKKVNVKFIGERGNLPININEHRYIKTVPN